MTHCDELRIHSVLTGERMQWEYNQDLVHEFMNGTVNSSAQESVPKNSKYTIQRPTPSTEEDDGIESPYEGLSHLHDVPEMLGIPYVAPQDNLREIPSTMISNIERNSSRQNQGGKDIATPIIDRGIRVSVALLRPYEELKNSQLCLISGKRDRRNE